MPRPNPLGGLIDIIEGFPPVDLQTGTAGLRTGDWVSCKNAAGILVVFHDGLGTAGDDPTLTFLQATTNAGGSSKAISPKTSSPNNCWKKQAATNLTGTSVWASAAADFTANAWLNTDAAEQDVLLAVWFDASDFDIANGFYWLNAGSSDVGSNAQPGTLLYLPLLEYPNAPASVVSAI